MRVLVIGANGYLGRALIDELKSQEFALGEPIERLMLLDQNLPGVGKNALLRCYPGSLTDKALLRRVLADGVDVVFHLASIAGGRAEQCYSLGYDVNLLATLELLHQLRDQSHTPVLVYASSVAVYGGNLPAVMDEHYLPEPELSYGAHKLMIESAICDLARRGEVDGRAIRLPGIVARPPEPNGLRSAFMSDIMYAVAQSQAYVCPVSAQATAWWMSVKCCVQNLLHAATLTPGAHRRVWQLPVLRLSIAQVLDTLLEIYGKDRRSLIEFAPDDDLEALFGRYPIMDTPLALAAGFCHDGNAFDLVKGAGIDSTLRSPAGG